MKTTESKEQTKQRLEEIKADMYRGRLSFANMNWLVVTLEEKLKGDK